jgi:hypothetical protein
VLTAVNTSRCWRTQHATASHEGEGPWAPLLLLLLLLLLLPALEQAACADSPACIKLLAHAVCHSSPETPWAYRLLLLPPPSLATGVCADNCP